MRCQMRLTFRNPSRRYVESLEARVTALEAIVNAIRNANSDSLPDIVREIRSGRDDIEYYAPLSTLPSRAKPDDSHEDAPSAPLQELGKIMGSLQLEEGQVSRLLGMPAYARYDISDPLPTCLLSQLTALQLTILPIIHILLIPNYGSSFIIPNW